MVHKQHIQTIHIASQLERFNIGFEYDKTLQQVKRDIRIKTI